MTKLFHILFFAALSLSIAKGQNKTNVPSTYGAVCYYTIKKIEFENFLKIKKAVENEDYSSVYVAIKKMKASLKSFKGILSDRSFELWYSGNYTDFNNQELVTKESTFTSLREYESRLRQKKALYYDHRLFLEQYLAYETEAFYSDYWFMSQERYFSIAAVDRVIEMNREEGKKLFVNSEFYTPFNIFNKMSDTEESNIRDYLDLQNSKADTISFIPFSYMILNKSKAGYVLEKFILDDATMDISVDREITALKKFLENARAGLIYFVARFNHLEPEKMKRSEYLKDRE